MTKYHLYKITRKEDNLNAHTCGVGAANIDPAAGAVLPNIDPAAGAAVPNNPPTRY